jgi:PAS domain S-box-containing protein
MTQIKKLLNRKDIPRKIRKLIQDEFERGKQVEEALRKHVQMIDLADDTIMIRNLKDKIVYWNKGAERLYGWKKNEAMGQYVHTFLNTVFPEPFKNVKKKFLKTGYWEGELHHIKRDGTPVVVASRWTLQKNTHGKNVAYLEINNDITRLKKAEDELMQAHNQLEKRVEERTAELKEANLKLEKVIRERKRLEKEILEISGMEQRRIGQDLHDGLSQHLTGIAFLGKVLEQKLSKKGVLETAQISEIVNLVNQAIAQTRGLARGLYPVELELNGLMSALQELASNTTKFFQVPCFFECEKPILINHHDAATHLYRIAQEAVTNAVKHAKSKRIDLRLIEKDDNVIMQIKDEGIGFPRKLSQSKGMGLRIMAYRSEIIGAELDIKPVSGAGTTVTCTVSKPFVRKKKK